MTIVRLPCIFLIFATSIPADLTQDIDAIVDADPSNARHLLLQSLSIAEDMPLILMFASGQWRM
jgi:hypothetical protein